jgi:hypothetical protein
LRSLAVETRQLGNVATLAAARPRKPRDLETADRHAPCSLSAPAEQQPVMSLEDTFTNLASFLNSLDAEGEQKFELSHSLVIICPDCGKNIAFRNRCPKCGGNSWIPAGHAGGIFEQMKAQRWRTQMQNDDDDDIDVAAREPEEAHADA